MRCEELPQDARAITATPHLSSSFVQADLLARHADAILSSEVGLEMLTRLAGRSWRLEHDRACVVGRWGGAGVRTFIVGYIYV